MRTRLHLTVGLIGLSLFAMAATPYTATPSYAIVASKAVMSDAAWRTATVDALQQKYPGAKVYTFEHSPEEVKAALAQQLPEYTAFVVKPPKTETATSDEPGVKFTIAISNLCRALDDDPYVDTKWGVITGADATAAGDLVSAMPIKIARALDCSGCDISAFQQAWRYTEDHRGIMNYWQAGSEKVMDVPCDTDNTQGVMTRLQKDGIQFLATSGHATQHNWDMGYSGPNMWMMHNASNQLVAIDTQRKPYHVPNPTPKVYFANGNCLIGDMKPACMALAWMKEGGVRQMMGYTVTTWYGKQGWGALGLFVDCAGLYSATEAFHFANTSIVEWLSQQGIPDVMVARMEEIRNFNMPVTPGIEAWANQEPDKAKRDAHVKDLSGHLHDRDVVCFYGDPALDARIVPGRYERSPWQWDEGDLVCTITCHVARTNLAIWVALPGSWTYAMTEPKADLAIDNMVRLPAADYQAGDKVTVRIKKPVRKGA